MIVRFLVFQLCGRRHIARLFVLMFDLINGSIGAGASRNYYNTVSRITDTKHV